MDYIKDISSSKDKEISTGGATIIVYDDSFIHFLKSNFKKYLVSEGFTVWHYGRNYDTSWIYVNINSKMYARGMPGMNVTAHLGKHAVTIDEFKLIYNIFKKYDGLPVLQME